MILFLIPTGLVEISSYLSYPFFFFFILSVASHQQGLETKILENAQSKSSHIPSRAG